LKLDIGLGKLAKALIPMPVKLKLGAKPPAPQPAKTKQVGWLKLERKAKRAGKKAHREKARRRRMSALESFIASAAATLAICILATLYAGPLSGSCPCIFPAC